MLNCNAIVEVVICPASSSIPLGGQNDGAEDEAAMVNSVETTRPIVDDGILTPQGAVSAPSNVESMRPPVAMGSANDPIAVDEGSCVPEWRRGVASSDHGTDDSSKVLADPVGKLEIQLKKVINEKLGAEDPCWQGLFRSDACLESLFGLDALFKFVGFKAGPVKETSAAIWRHLMASQNCLDYEGVHKYLTSVGASTTRITADRLSSVAFEHLGGITRLGGLCCRMPLLTYSTFLVPGDFRCEDQGILFYFLLNTMLLAEGGVRKTFNAKYCRKL